MEAEVTFLTRRGTAIMRRPLQVNAERIRFGRGTDNEVPLPDIRVELSAAALSRRADGLVIEKLGNSPMRVNGNTMETSIVRPGDEIVIGPYRIEIVEPTEGCEAAATVELVQPMGDALGRLVAESRIGLPMAAVSKRAMAWTFFVVVFAICLILPAAIYWGGVVPPWKKDAPAAGPASIAGLSWNVGDFSNPHRFFASNCSTCHQNSFIAVPDTACLTCHATVGSHAEKNADIGTLRQEVTDTRCTHCHQEHRGVRGTVVRDASLCLDCHGTITKKAPKAGVLDVAGFPDGHPQFRLTLVANAAGKKTERVEIGKQPAHNMPGIKFVHAAHLVKGGFPALKYKEMVCADCHVAEPGGLGFAPVTYEGQCARCHALKFDRVDLPWAEAKVPHGDDAGVVGSIWNFYAGKALRGEMADATPAVPRRSPGMTNAAGDAAQPEVQAWVAQKTAVALSTIVDEKNRVGCGYCHYGTGPQGLIDTAKVVAGMTATGADARTKFIAPVILRSRFLPQAVFNHARHAALDCGDCHTKRRDETKAALRQLPITPPDPMDVPGIENCIGCHGAENASLRAESTCISCHDFHRNEFGPMRPDAATTQ